MPKFMFIETYTHEGLRTIKESGASARRKLAEGLAANVGGTVESMLFAVDGGLKVYIVADLPDVGSATAIQVAAGGSGDLESGTGRLVQLLTAEELDDAVATEVGWSQTRATALGRS
jgi:uncharacterized protein with GYD domain